MIKVDGKRTNLEGGDELLQRELTLLIAVMKSRLESKGQNDAANLVLLSVILSVVTLPVMSLLL